MLNEYERSFKIRGRVVFKSQMKTYKKNKGEGQLFSIIIVDETSAIQATFHN